MIKTKAIVKAYETIKQNYAGKYIIYVQYMNGKVLLH